MDYEKTLEELKHMKVETGSFICLGCGHEHNCSIRGCAILRDAVECIEELKRVLRESEAARADLGKRLAAAQQELAEAERCAETLAGELLTVRASEDLNVDVVKMNFGYSRQLSYEALEAAVWSIARKILREDKRLRELSGAADGRGESLELYFNSHGFHGVPKEEGEKRRLVNTAAESLAGVSAEANRAVAKVCRRFLERMDDRNGR